MAKNDKKEKQIKQEKEKPEKTNDTKNEVVTEVENTPSDEANVEKEEIKTETTENNTEAVVNVDEATIKPEEEEPQNEPISSTESHEEVVDKEVTKACEEEPIKKNINLGYKYVYNWNGYSY